MSIPQWPLCVRSPHVSPFVSALVMVALAVIVPASSLYAAAPGAAKDLYVTNDVLNAVDQYDGQTGAYVGTFATSFAGQTELGIHFDAQTNRLYVGHAVGGMEEFDGTTGAYIKTYNAAGIWQWAGLVSPTGNVLIDCQSTNDVRSYNAATGALLGVFVAGFPYPNDMRIGPNGDLYICDLVGGFVMEVNASTGAPVSSWSLPSGAQANDIAFLPGGEILVTATGPNVVYRYDSAHNLLGSFAGTGMTDPHGIDISPWDGNIYVVDGATNQVHVFDSVNFTELSSAFLSPPPGGKCVDLTFKPEAGATATQSSTWGQVKGLFR